MELLEFRPLLFAIIEYSFVVFIILKGKSQLKYLAALFIFFLASYQLGEFLLFATGAQWTIQFAFIATVLVHPVALKAIETITGKHLGFKISIVVALGLVVALIINPNLVAYADQCYCFAKFVAMENSRAFVAAYSLYTTVSLLAGMFLTGYYLFKARSKEVRSVLKYWLISYVLPFPGSILLLLAFTGNTNDYLASVMCALGIIAAFIITYSVTKAQR